MRISLRTREYLGSKVSVHEYDHLSDTEAKDRFLSVALNNRENYWGQSPYKGRDTLQMPDGKYSYVKLIKQGVGTLVLHEAGSGQTDYWQWADGTIQLDTTGDFKFHNTIAESLQYFDEIQAWDPAIPLFRENSEKISLSYPEIRAEFMQMFGYKDLMPSDLFEGLKDEFRSKIQNKITNLPYAQYAQQIQIFDSALMRELQLVYNAYAYAPDRYIQKNVQDFLQFLGPNLRLKLRGIEYFFQAIGQQDSDTDSPGNKYCNYASPLQIIYYGLIKDSEFGNQWAENLYTENLMAFGDFHDFKNFKSEFLKNPNKIMKKIVEAINNHNFNELSFLQMANIIPEIDLVTKELFTYGDGWVRNIDIRSLDYSIFDGNLEAKMDYIKNRKYKTIKEDVVLEKINNWLSDNKIIYAEFTSLRDNSNVGSHWVTIIDKLEIGNDYYYIISDSDSPYAKNNDKFIQGQFIIVDGKHIKNNFYHGIVININ